MTMFRPLVLAGLAALAGVPAAAQTAPDSALLQCRAIEKKNDRLACFDAALDAAFGVDAATEADRARRQRDNFGDAAADEDDTAKEFVGTIAFVDFDPRYNILQFQLDNGTVWRATTQGSLRNGFEPGQAVRIQPGLLGSYRLTMEGKAGFRGVKRVK